MARADPSRAVPSRASPSRAALELSLAAVVIALIFGAALILPLPFWHTQPAAPPPPDQPPATDLGWPVVLLALGFALALCLPFRPYLRAVRSAAQVGTRTIVLLSAGLALLGLLIYPAFGSDLFVYVDYERLWVIYGVNPLLAFPALHPEDWAYRFTWIPQQPSPYGPLWPLLTWPIARLAGESLWGWIIGYKLLALLSYVTCCGLIWRSTPGDRRTSAFVQFAWSPLVLFDLLGKAHNDGLLAVAALAAVWTAGRSGPLGGTETAARGRRSAMTRLTTLLAAAAGMLVKLSGFAVVLALLLGLARQRAWRQLTLGVLAVLVLTAALYAPFWDGPASLAPVLVQTTRIVWSPGALFIAALGPDTPAAALLVRSITAALWVASLALVARRSLGLAADTAIVLLATLLLLTTAFFAHYLVPIVALAAVAANRRLTELTVALSIGSLAAYSVELLGPAFAAGWIGSRTYQALGSLVTLGPALLLVASWWLQTRLTRPPVADARGQLAAAPVGPQAAQPPARH